MPTQGQTEMLGSAAQDILDGRDFSEVQADIEQIAADAPDDWYGARICKLPPTAAYDHLVATRAIANIMQGNVAEASSGASTFERYLAMTAEVDKAAAQQVIEGRRELAPTLVEAYKYLELQFARIVDYEAAHPDHPRRRGKSSISMAVDKSLVAHSEGNARVNSMATVVREALRVCLAEGTVPGAGELTDKIKTNLRQHAGITRLPGQVFRRVIFGQKLTSEHHRSLQTGQAIDLTKWNEILKELAENDNLLPIAHELADTIQADLTQELSYGTSARTLGFCAAQFALRPYGPSCTSRFFGLEGILLPEGTFKVTEYQLLRGLQAARVTIFADPLYRKALGQLAGMLRQAKLC